MKKFFTILGIAAASFAMSQNLVVNPTFDNGFTGWTAGPTAAYTAPTVVATDGSDGANSVNYVTNATTGFYQELPVTPGHSITITFFYKAAGDGTDARIWSVYKDAAGVIINQEAVAANDPLRNNNGYLPSAATWAPHSVTVTVPANAVTLQLAVRAYSGSTVSFDQFSVIDNNTMAVSDVTALNSQFVKNTIVDEEINFGSASEVRIFNMSSQVVKRAYVSEHKNMYVADLKPGIYIVTGIVNGQPVSQRILKK